jgi:predicted transcriptional regulator
MAGSNPALIVRVAATIEELKANLAQGVSQIETTTAAMGKLAASFSGDKLIQAAQNVTAAVDSIGGASKLTEPEMARVNSTIEKALEKYRVLGKEAPAGMLALADATKKIEPERMLALADATKKIEPPLSLADKAAGLLKSTLGQFTIAGLATSAIQKLSAGLMDFIDLGIRLPAIEAAFQRLNVGVGQNSTEMLAALTTGTKGMVSDFDLMQSANKAMLLGLPVTTASMGELAKTATVLGRAMGQDATKSLDDLIVALGRSSPMILDNLGLSVKVGEANEIYAAKLGKSADALTDAEKKTAFYNAAMEAARKKTAELGEQTETLGEILDRVWVKSGNVVTETAGTLNVGIGAILTSGKQFALFLADVPSLGLAAAVQMAALREKTGALKTTLDETGPAVKTVGDKTAEMTAWIDSLQKGVAKLTPQQQTWIDQLVALNISETDIAKRIEISESAVKTYTESVKTRAVTVKAAIEDEQKAQIAYADLEDHLHRVAIGHWKEQEEAKKKQLATVNAAVIDGNAQIMTAAATLHDFEMKESMDTSTYQIMKIWETAEAQIKAFDGSIEQRQRYADLVYTIADREAKGITDVMAGALDTMASKSAAVIDQAAAKTLAAVSYTVNSIFSLGGSAADMEARAAALGGYVAHDDYGNPYIYIPGVNTAPHRAEGGPVSSGQPYLVGERGPELFVPASSGSIVPHGSSGGGGTTIINHIYVTQPLGTPDAIGEAITARMRSLAMRLS